MCETEVLHAANWFGEQLFEPNEQRAIFVERLQELLVARFQGHWYPDEPHRGCAFRAILSTVNALDPLLLRAAESTGQRGLHESFCRQFSDVGEVNCWINPGEVKVLRGRTQQVIYSDGTGSDNPYSKLRINIEPTRLAVKVDHVEPQVPNSPVSSSGGHLLGGGDAFSAFRGHGNSSQGCSSQACSSQGESPTESPMQSWRMGANAPPAMAPLPPHMGANGNGGYGSFGNQGFDGSMGAGSFDASMAGIRGSFDGMGGGMGGGMSSAMGSVGLGGGGSFGGANGLPPQSQQQPQQAPSSAVPHSSPMRGYSSYGGPTSYGQTPQQPVF